MEDIPTERNGFSIKHYKEIWQQPVCPILSINHFFFLWVHDRGCSFVPRFTIHTSKSFTTHHNDDFRYDKSGMSRNSYRGVPQLHIISYRTGLAINIQ